MSQILTQDGRFKARPRSWAVEENKNTGTLQLVMAFGVTEAWTGQAWEDWSPYDLEKTGYFYLAKKDGSPNEACIRALREALGWDGLDLEALQNTDWTQKVVQITTGFEDYNGEQRLKVRFINPENWEGAQSKPLDAAALKALNSKWGPKLRAAAPKSGPRAPAAATAKPPAAPAKPAAPPPASPLPPPAAPTADEAGAAPAASTREKVWAKVLEIFGGDDAAARAAWPQLLKQVIPNKHPAKFTPADWAAVESRAGEAIPY